ncbi:MAG: hypothetical protein AABX93_01955 [Nanoarchaeota archaeon]
MKIAIDCDDVLVDFIGTFVRFHNENYGTNLTRDDFHTFSFSKILGIGFDEGKRKSIEFMESLDLWNAEPINHSREVLEKIKNSGNSLYLVTSRPELMGRITEEWLDRNFPNLFLEIYFSRSAYTNSLMPNKANICKQIGAKVLVEDNPDHLINLNETEALLYDAPWNKNHQQENVTRVHSWKDIESFFTTLRQAQEQVSP